jgi:D-3-phosphoglycerate dehydrogenase / 2-oxoglutarate reductase
MKVLIADKFEDSGRAAIAGGGCELDYRPGTKDDALVEAIRSTGADVLVVRSTKVTRQMLEAGRLALVVRAGAGVNTIDVAAASARGIYVANCPGKNSVAVAELAFALMLALDRRVADNVADLRGGVWNKAEYSKARGLFGRTLGLVGVGEIGKEMIPRARAMGMRVVAWSRRLTPQRADELGIERKDSPAQVAAACDVLSVHVAADIQTKHLIGEDVFLALRPGAIFINTARAEVVDHAALARAITERGLRVGLDVFPGEPSGGTGAVAEPLFKLPNVIGTHHIGASTDQAQEAIAAETARIVLAYKATGRAPNVVNLAKKSPATHILLVRHLDRVGVLAAVFDRIKSAGINVQETENIVFEGANAALARIHVNQAPSADELKAIEDSTDDILALSLVPLSAKEGTP